ncbi:hypothetical protein SDJN03_05485, partial [Cucurbita argyrosperma subsp. sororia]
MENRSRPESSMWRFSGSVLDHSLSLRELCASRVQQGWSTCDILASNAVVASKLLPLFSKTSNYRTDDQHCSFTCSMMNEDFTWSSETEFIS